MFQAGAITYAQPSVTKVGGVTQMRKVMALADAFGVNVVPHSAYFGPGLIASIHCIAAMPNESLVERYDADFAVNPLHDAINPGPDGALGHEPNINVGARSRVEAKAVAPPAVCPGIHRELLVFPVPTDRPIFHISFH